ncbi:hypothetical protein GCM10010448_09430 [Streptomyces glomeratus]|uniref:Uncharacterized protein n=1 Tax=Streptomyces glomeratus TaxID=284452 RepID=A0ABP6L1I8_9ACTN
MPAGRADGPVEPPVRVVHVDERQPGQRLRGGADDHHGGTVVPGPFLVPALELDGNPGRVALEGAQWISTRALHRGLSLLVHQYRDSGLEQGVERCGLALLVVVVLYEGVVTQKDGCEPVQIIRDLRLGNTFDPCPDLGLSVVRRVREEFLQSCDVTDRRLPRTPVEPRRIARLQAAGRPAGPHPGVVAESAALVEEGSQRRDSGGDGLHRERLCVSAASAEEQHGGQQKADPPDR